MTTKMTRSLTDFLNSWTTDPNHTKESFCTLKNHLETLPNARFEFIPRPGITYSLRAVHLNQKSRPLFAMVDIIDDDPADRWLSIVFYKDMVSDPMAEADEVPEGLFDEDARCFDLYEHDENLVQYIMDRMDEAAAAAAGS